MEEDGGVEGGVESSAGKEFIVDDSVGHCLLVDVSEGAWGRGWERKEGGEVDGWLLGW